MASEPGSRIERQILVNAPRSRVWRALTTPGEFAQWFHVAFEGEFVPGNRIDVVCTFEGTAAGVKFYMIVDRMEPERLFSWRWHPGMPRPGVDYEKEPMTTVTFTLEEREGGTLVTVAESGFDSIPLSRRAGVFTENEGGWKVMTELLAQHATRAD